MSCKEYHAQVLGWIHAIENHRGKNAELLLQNCKDVKQYAVQMKDEALLGFSYYYMGEAFYFLNDLERLFRYINLSLGYLERSRQWQLAAKAYHLLAATSFGKGNIMFALDYYLKGLSYCRRFQLDEESCLLHMQMAALYLHTGEYKQAQVFYEDAFRQFCKLENCKNEIVYKITIYLGLGKTYLYRAVFDVARKYMRKADKECLEAAEPLDRLHFSLFQVLYFNAAGMTAQRDMCIPQIQRQMMIAFPLLEMFDELYAYAKMLFSIFYYQEFWEVLYRLEAAASQAKTAYFQKKIVGLQIQYYKRMKDTKNYLRCSGRFYELSEALEQENSYMISGMLDIRRTLDSETKMRLEMEKENAALAKRSQTDALTGLWNRFRMNTYAEEAFERAKNRKSNFAIEILDVDYFKQYNDNYGHQAGDSCLAAVAKVFKSMQCKEKITAFRYGGDEFVILYEGYGIEQVQQMMAELKTKILNLELTHAYSKAAQVVTISQGASIGIPARESRISDFLQAADMVLYQVKKKSRNHFALEVYKGQKKEKRSVV